MSAYGNATVSVGTTATLIGSFGLVVQTNNVLIKNNGTATVYLGDATVTANLASTGGYQLAPGEKVVMPTQYNTSGGTYDLYGITAAGTALVSYVGA